MTDKKDQILWVQTNCKSPTCRGLRHGGQGFTVTVTVVKGTEDKAICNECYGK